MCKLNMDWFAVGEMTIDEIKTCIRVRDEVRKLDDLELYNVVFAAVVNANGGDKNGKAIKLHEEEKKPMSQNEIRKEMELLKVK